MVTQNITFDAGVGYWAIVSEDLSFSYETGSMARSEIRRYVETRPSGRAFTVAQSPNQAFYFVDNITLDEGIIEEGDWLLSYNGNVLTGIHQTGRSVARRNGHGGYRYYRYPDG